MKWILCLLATAFLVCGSDQARIRRQFGSFDYPSNQFGNQFFPNQGPQNQFGGPSGVLFPGQNGFNGGNQQNGGQQFQGQNGLNPQNGQQFQGQNGQNGQQGQNGQGQNNFNQGNFQPNGQQGQIQQTTAAPIATAAPTTLAPQVQRCVDSCIGVTTNQYNPVCGTNMQTYHNQERLDCARECGVNLQRQAIGVCPRATG